MKYQMLVLDLDGTLTNSKKEITEPTRKALLEIQKEGKICLLYTSSADICVSAVSDSTVPEAESVSSAGVF